MRRPSSTRRRIPLLAALAANLAFLASSTSMAAAQSLTFPALTATEPWFDITIDSPQLSRPTVRLVDTDFGASPSDPDITVALNNAIQACHNVTGGCVVTFSRPNGVYRVEGGTDGRSINIVDLKDFVFDGQNSTFVFSRPPQFMPRPNYAEQSCTPRDYEPGFPAVIYGSYLGIDRCTRCEVRNIAMDWDWSRYRLANLVNVLAATNSSWTLEMLEVPSIETPRDTFAFKSVHTVNTTTNTMGNINGSEIYVYQAKAPEFTRLTATTFRLDFEKPNTRTPDIGSRMLLRHFTYEFHAAWIFRSTHLTFRNFRLFGCAGKAFVFGRGVSNVHFDRFVMAPPGPGDHQTTNLTRHITCSSDGLFFDSTKGNVLIENSEISHHGDDCVNFNSPVSGGIPVAPGIELVNSSAVYIRGNRYIDYFPGDGTSLLGLPSYSLLSDSLGVVRSARGDGCGNWTLVFEDGTFDAKSLQGRNLSKLMVINNDYDASRLVVRNLSCHHNRARGILVQGNDVAILDSSFHDIQMGGILVRVHGKEGEGSGAENVLIARNTFRDVDLIGEYNGTAVSVYAKEPSGYQVMSLPWIAERQRITGRARPGGMSPNRGVSIRDNLIVNTPRAAIEVSAAQAVLVQNNTILNQLPLPVVPEPWYVGEWKFRGSVVVRVASDVTVRGNRWVDDGFNAQFLGYIESNTTRNVVFDSNYVYKRQVDGTLTRVSEINVTTGTVYDVDARTNFPPKPLPSGGRRLVAAGSTWIGGLLFLVALLV
ncbi:pectin lyase fold/virulence factor [Hyaloraphidium curvatum]|nr:pectin lyase fold/virulence factor [Hyaloraphidium curvatum]